VKFEMKVDRVASEEAAPVAHGAVPVCRKLSALLASRIMTSLRGR